MFSGCSASRQAICRSCGLLRRPRLSRPRPLARIPSRRYAHAASGSAAPAADASPLAPLASLTGELDRIAPRFAIDASQIDILRDPAEFYDTLKSKIRNAKRHIYLSTLYIGKTEHELISTIHDALKSNPDLTVSFLTDALRGTRETPEPSCASLLAPLVAEFGSDRVQVRMYHTPNLTGLRKRMIPKRINEGWGLQHMKLYGVDDEMLMSGANLSNDYFTNRQDRYHVFRSPELTSYYRRIHSTVCSISYLLQPTSPQDPTQYTLIWPSENPGPAPLDDPAAYVKTAAKLLQPLIRPPTSQSAPSRSSDTLIYPVFQFTPLLGPHAANDTSTELPALTSVLSHLSAPSATSPGFKGASWTFTAGYLNFTPQIRDLLLASNPHTGTVIAASPYANGFYGSRGVSGMLPAAYTLLARRFVTAVQRAGLASQIRLLEWRHGTVGEPGGWTYHAKGVWITLASAATGAPDVGPSISLVGSSNYTARSYGLDLEANALIVTRNAGLMRRLRDEELWLRKHAAVVDEAEFLRTERRVGVHVRVAMWIVGLVGGAL